MINTQIFTYRETLYPAMFVVLAVVSVIGVSPQAAPAQCANPSWNGYCPETVPRPGEQRISSFQYKASHNSYERSESLNEQMDAWNVWMLELDCWWLDNNIHVRHLCFGFNGPSLTEELQEIAASVTAFSRFTFIYLELKYDCTNDNCQCGSGETCHDWPADYRNQFRTRIESELIHRRIYTANDWQNIDSYRWPSYQELVRRGKNYAFIIDERCTGDGGNDYFFEATTAGSGYTTLINQDAGCDGGGSPSPVTPTTRYLYRAYPGGSCGGLCDQQNGSYWTDAVAAGFTFIATNCVNGGHTMTDPAIHSPAPMYVVNVVPPIQFGTVYWPYGSSAGLTTATQKVSPMVPVLIQGGTYTISGSLPNQTINRPMVLKGSAPTELVVIR